MDGLVIRGSRNIFTVRIGTGEIYSDCKVSSGIFPYNPNPGPHSPLPTPHSPYLECRIKGKVLKDAEGYYNPLAPGDRVTVEPDPGRPGTGMITALLHRENFFSRFNQKGGNTQLLASNVDLVLCLTTYMSPPFRPRFIDRVLLQTEFAGIPVCIVCNKTDLECDDIDVTERLEDFRHIGYTVMETSAKTGAGLDELRRLINGKRTVLVGQSGVGKSSLINSLLPELKIKTGDINQKYDRGNHTTVLASLIDILPDTQIIDTPGIRRFVPDGIAPDEIILYMREFAPLAGKCSFGLSCSHRVEPGCKIMEAVHAGVIHEDRYTSFLRIHDELSGKNNAD